MKDVEIQALIRLGGSFIILDLDNCGLNGRKTNKRNIFEKHLSNQIEGRW